MKKRVLTIILAMVFGIGLLPVTASASVGGQKTEGTAVTYYEETRIISAREGVMPVHDPEVAIIPAPVSTLAPISTSVPAFTAMSASRISAPKSSADSRPPIGEYNPAKCDVNISDMQWSLPTLDGNVITQSSRSDKIQIYIFGLLDLDATCPRTRRTISRIAESNIFQSPDIDIIFVDTNDNTKETVRAFQEYYMPKPHNITFAYGSEGRELFWKMVEKFSSGSEGYMGYTINFVIKNHRIVYAWHSETGLFPDAPRKYDIICSKLGVDVGVIETNDGATGGNYYIDKSSGVIIGADDSIVTLDIPPTVEGVFVKGIDEYAFDYLKQLTTLTLPEGATEIGSYGVSYCKSLSSVVLPGTITSLDGSSIYGCDSLKDIYYNGTNQKIYNQLSSMLPNSGSVHMRSGSITHFTSKTPYQAGLFNDVKEDDWFYDNVSDTYSIGLMNGTGAGTFSPCSDMTLAEVVALAARIHSLYHNGKESFARYDGGSWYDPYVDYARKNRIIDVSYSFTRPATREEVVHILARALPEEELKSIAGTVSFADSRDIVYISDVQLLSEAGVINGISENGQIYFKPAATITRAEVAAVVARMAKPDSRIRQ